MAWPLSILTSYTAGTVPALKAADLNAIQDAIVGIVGGTLTLKSLDLDGTGGGAGSAPAGTVRPSASISGYSTTPPFMLPPVPLGALHREQVVLGAARCFIGGFSTIQWCGGFNVREVVRVAKGAFYVTFHTAFPDVNRHVPIVTTGSNSGSDRTLPSLYLAGVTIVDGGCRVLFRTYDKDGLQADPHAFSVVVFGG